MEDSLQEKLREKHVQTLHICTLQQWKNHIQEIARFKVEYSDLIDEAFKTTIKIAKDNDLIKIHHLSLDGTKIKAKTSINKLTDENQIKIMKEHLQKSIERDQQEDVIV